MAKQRSSGAKRRARFSRNTKAVIDGFLASLKDQHIGISTIMVNDVTGVMYATPEGQRYLDVIKKIGGELPSTGVGNNGA